jgi:hypothetical protein
MHSWMASSTRSLKQCSWSNKSTGEEHENILKGIITLHPVGFEPTSANTVQLECIPLDRSGTDAM